MSMYLRIKTLITVRVINNSMRGTVILFIPIILLVPLISDVWGDTSHYGLEFSRTCESLEKIGEPCLEYDVPVVIFTDDLQAAYDRVAPEDLVTTDRTIEAMKIDCIRAGNCDDFVIGDIALWLEPTHSMKKWIDMITVVPKIGVGYVASATPDEVATAKSMMENNTGTISLYQKELKVESNQTEIIESIVLEGVILQDELTALALQWIDKQVWVDYVVSEGWDDAEALNGLDDIKDEYYDVEGLYYDKLKELEFAQEVLRQDGLNRIELEILINNLENENKYLWLIVGAEQQATFGHENVLRWNVNQVWVNLGCNEAVFESRGDPLEIVVLTEFMDDGCRDYELLDSVFELDYIVTWKYPELVDLKDSPAWSELEKWKEAAILCKDKC